MKKILFILAFFPLICYGQFHYWGPTFDSTTFTFSATDSFVHPISYFGSTVSIDTSGARLWQVGRTLKPVFSNGVTAVRGIMTDTANHYPANANDFFVLKMTYPYNSLINFWHRYQTDSLHAGGLVEFSTDGTTWMNITACPGIATENFYSAADTLIGGPAAFTGTRSVEQLSRFQLMNCMALRVTATACFPDYWYGTRPIYIRFRFVSDSTADTLSGWMIDSIKVVYTGCGAGINNVSTESGLQIYPNPVTNELFISAADKIDEVCVYTITGELVRREHIGAEKARVDVADLPAGMYFAKVNGTIVRKFVRQ